MSSRVSVLVAVYNAEQWLARCLDSLIGQTHLDLQILCIDDASTDDSLKILRQYEQQDARVQVIALSENHGQAFARNQGLIQADGDYVCFLDADDWYAPDALQQAVDEFRLHPDADCVLFDVDYVYPDHSELYAMPPFESLTGEEAFRMSLDWTIHGVYMVRRELHQRYPYDDTCRSYSDDNTTRLHFLSSRSVRRCKGVYHYLQHAASVTHAFNVRRFDFLRANESMKRQLQALGMDGGVMSLWETQRMLTLVDLYMFYHCHAQELSAADAAYGLQELKRVWATIEPALLDPARTRKFGYRLMPSWTLFRLQEWLYFTIRGWMGKNH